MEGERLNLRNWSLLPKELFDLIVERLGPSDLIQVSCVCSTWRSILRPLPLWLLLPCHDAISISDDENDDFNEDNRLVNPFELACVVPMCGISKNKNENNRNEESNSVSDPEKALGFLGFVNLSNPSRKIHKLQIPEAEGCTILASSAGWLVTLRVNGAIRLLHPFSRAKIELPPIKLANFGSFMGKINKMSIEKVIVGLDSDGKSLIICKYAGKLALYRPEKDLKWVAFKHCRGVIEDVVSYNGRFYGVRNGRNKCHVCVACDLDGPSATMEEVVEIPKCSNIQYYLVESSGNLLMVLRHLNWPMDCNTIGFTVFRLDLNGMVEVKDLADQALFLDSNSAYSVSASDFPAFKGNRIYFVSTCFPNIKSFGFCDMEVFNFEDKSFEAYDYCDDYELIMHGPIIFPTNPCWRGGLGFRMV